jgi:hypothetical protein
MNKTIPTPQIVDEPTAAPPRPYSSLIGGLRQMFRSNVITNMFLVT